MAKQEPPILEQFVEQYGNNETKLEAWQLLCRDVGVSAGPSITQCKMTLRRVHMNLVDFARCKSQGRIPRHFKSSGALAQYIKPSGDRFPLNLAKQNVFLKALLREVR